jgi:hypothetical protein
VFRRFPLLEHLLQTLSHGPHRTLNIQNPSNQSTLPILIGLDAFLNPLPLQGHRTRSPLTALCLSGLSFPVEVDLLGLPSKSPLAGVPDWVLTMSLPPRPSITRNSPFGPILHKITTRSRCMTCPAATSGTDSAMTTALGTPWLRCSTCRIRNAR